MVVVWLFLWLSADGLWLFVRYGGGLDVDDSAGTVVPNALHQLLNLRVG